jgi:ankyrin repeat protein
MKGGETPLHLAVFCGKAEIVKALLEKGADINLVDKSETSPIMLSIQSLNDEIFKIFVPLADLQWRNEKGNTLLHEACNYGNAKAVVALLQKGADIIAQNNTGNTGTVPGMVVW